MLEQPTVSEVATAAFAPAEPGRPWRCPRCGYDAREAALGDRCSECGTELDAASIRPPWLTPNALSHFDGAGGLGVLGGVLLALFPMFAGAALGMTVLIGPVAATGLLGAMFLGMQIIPVVAIRMFAAAAADDPRISRLGCVAWWRLGLIVGVVGLAAMVGTGAVAFPIFSSRVPPTMLGVIGTQAILVSGVAVCDIRLTLGVGSVARRGMGGIRWWHRGVLLAAPALIGLMAAISLLPLAGWAVGITGWGLVMAAVFGVLASASGRMRRLERAGPQ